MIPTLILNHQRLVREGWADFLSVQSGIVLAGHTGDPYEACQLARQHQPKIVLASDELILALQFNRLATIHESSPGAAVVLITSHFSDGLQEQLSRLGVRGCLSNNSSLAEILTAIVKVNSGSIYASPSLLGSPEFPYDGSGFDGVSELTARELEIVGMLVTGRTSRDVAGVLGISAKTVEVHRHNILTKMGCRNTTMLVNKLSIPFFARSFQRQLVDSRGDV